MLFSRNFLVGLLVAAMAVDCAATGRLFRRRCRSRSCTTLCRKKCATVASCCRVRKADFSDGRSCCSAADDPCHIVGEGLSADPRATPTVAPAACQQCAATTETESLSLLDPSAEPWELPGPAPVPAKTYAAEVVEQPAIGQTPPGGPNSEPRGVAAGRAVLPPPPLAAPEVSDFPSHVTQPSASVTNLPPAAEDPSGSVGIPSGGAGIPSGSAGTASGEVGIFSAPADAPPKTIGSSGSRTRSLGPAGNSPLQTTPAPTPIPTLAKPQAVEIVGDRYSEQAEIFGPPAVNNFASPVPATDPPEAASGSSGGASDTATTDEAAAKPDRHMAATAAATSPSVRPQNPPDSGLPAGDRPAGDLPGGELGAGKLGAGKLGAGKPGAGKLPADDIEAYQLFSNPKEPAATPAPPSGRSVPETANSRTEKPTLAEPIEDRLRPTASPRTAEEQPATTLPEPESASNEYASTEGTYPEASDQPDAETDAETQEDRDFYDLFGPAAPSGEEETETIPIEDARPGSAPVGDPSSDSRRSGLNDSSTDRGLEPLGAEFSEDGRQPAVLTQAGGLLSAAVRTWRDDTDSFQCEARLVHVTSKQVILRQPGGAQLAVSIRRLGQADLQFVHQQVVALRLARTRDAAAEKLAVAWVR